MAKQDMDEVLQQLIDTIRSAYKGVPLEFSPRVFERHAELWVYGIDMDEKKYQDVDRRCQELTLQHEQDDVPVWVFAKAWSGPWPGGESESELKRKRRELLDRIKREREQGQQTRPSGTPA